MNVDGTSYQVLEFVDVCAAYGERLQVWRTAALDGGMPPERVKASMAVDVQPRDEDVHEMNVVDFLNAMPAKSVKIANGDWINVKIPGKDNQREAGGLGRIIDDVRRVLIKNGELLLTMPLNEHASVMRIVRDARLEIKPIAFGYVGFLGGKNSKGFPVDGLPPVEGESHFIRAALEEAKEKEEGENSAIASIFAEWIGTHGYAGCNPVRYRAVKKKN